MARDRQRAKQRRRAREGSASTPPNPLKHSSADVDEALFAESGGPAPPFADEVINDESEFRTAPDQIEGDLVPSKYEQADIEHELVSGEERRLPLHRRTIAFLGHVIDELRRVQWPNRRQTIQGTAVTIGFVIVAGAYLGLLDAIWKPLVDLVV